MIDSYSLSFLLHPLQFCYCCPVDTSDPIANLWGVRNLVRYFPGPQLWGRPGIPLWACFELLHYDRYPIIWFSELWSNWLIHREEFGERAFWGCGWFAWKPGEKGWDVWESVGGRGGEGREGKLHGWAEFQLHQGLLQIASRSAEYLFSMSIHFYVVLVLVLVHGRLRFLRLFTVSPDAIPIPSPLIRAASLCKSTSTYNIGVFLDY